jgi:haloalkane dehalogenase
MWEKRDKITAFKRFNFFARVIMRQACGDKTKLTEHIHRHYLKPLEAPEERKGCWVFPGEILGSTAWLSDLWARRSLLTDKPKLIVWGLKDIAFREQELNTWIDAFPDAEVIKLDDVGHYVQEEAPGELGQAVRHFLTQGSDVPPREATA